MTSFLEHCVEIYGNSSKLITDYGPQFVSMFFVETVRTLEMDHKNTSENQPETNRQKKKF